MSYGTLSFGTASHGGSRNQIITGQGFNIFINGMDVTCFLKTSTFKATETLKQRNIINFTLVDVGLNKEFSVGQSVTVIRDSLLLYTGTLETVSRTVPNSSNTAFFKIKGVDGNAILDRKLVIQSYTTQPAGDIVKAIIGQFLSAEGITQGVIQDGVEIQSARFNYAKASSALDALANRSGLFWFVDPFKRLNFADRTSFPSGIVLDDDNKKYITFTRKNSRNRYRNVQFLRGGNGETFPQVEKFVGNDEQETFTIKFPLAVTPTVLVNGVPQTVGIRELDVGKEWYYNIDDKQISQDEGLPRLTGFDTLEIQYIGLFPIVVLAEDALEVATRQAIEGGSGRYEMLETDERVNTRENAVSKVDSLLEKFGEIPEDLKILTDDNTWKVGQVITVDIDEEAVSEDFLVTSIGWKEFDQIQVLDGSFPRYTVKATSGQYFGGWVEFFRQLEEAGTTFSIKENEVLEFLGKQSDAILFTDDLNLIDPVDDGTNDPFTSLETAAETDADEEIKLVGASNVGRDVFF